jgi:hypothetical protein
MNMGNCAYLKGLLYIFSVCGGGGWGGITIIQFYVCFFVLHIAHSDSATSGNGLCNGL